MRNAQNLRTIASIIEAHPDMHNQKVYVKGLEGGNRSGFVETVIQHGRQTISCGSSQCIAGWAIAIENGKVEIEQSGWGGGSEPRLRLPGGETLGVTSIDEEAARILGLNDGEAETLFHSIPQEQVNWPQLLRNLADGMGFFDAIESAWKMKEMDSEEIREVISDCYY